MTPPLTVFAMPKSSRGLIADIQRNALASWRWIDPHIEILIFAEDRTTHDLAAGLHVRVVEDHVERNEFGTPRVDYLFRRATGHARSDVLCYVNADIILSSSLLLAAAKAARRFEDFLLVGERTDVPLREALSFDESWERRVHLLADSVGRPHGPTGMDYFVFRRGMFDDMPPFAIGRPAWDNWCIADSRRKGIPVIDATRAVLAVHQDHDYSHVQGRRNGSWDGPEADFNRRLAGPTVGFYTLSAATWFLTERGTLLPNLRWRHLRKRWGVWRHARPPGGRSGAFPVRRGREGTSAAARGGQGVDR
ncbi:MAG TPA: hypothetical protein VHF25_03700 [Nitriliruptorales bacterium]|nr:hypothetical protein [Nitriliruptorales bacterium]